MDYTGIRIMSRIGLSLSELAKALLVESKPPPHEVWVAERREEVDEGVGGSHATKTVVVKWWGRADGNRRETYITEKGLENIVRGDDDSWACLNPDEYMPPEIEF